MPLLHPPSLTPPLCTLSSTIKMAVLDRLLVKLKARGHRVVLFSQFNIMVGGVELVGLGGAVQPVQHHGGVDQLTGLK